MSPQGPWPPPQPSTIRPQLFVVSGIAGTVNRLGIELGGGGHQARFDQWGKTVGYLGIGHARRRAYHGSSTGRLSAPFDERVDECEELVFEFVLDEVTAIGYHQLRVGDSAREFVGERRRSAEVLCTADHQRRRGDAPEPG